ARKLPHRRVMRSWPVLVRVVRFQSLRSYARARSQSYAGCVNLPARHPRLVAASKTRMAGTSPATTNEDSAEVMTVAGQSRNPRLGVLRQDLLAAFLGDRDVEYPVERVEGGVRPVRGIQEPVLALAQGHQQLEVLGILRKAHWLAGEADVAVEIF